MITNVGIWNLIHFSLFHRVGETEAKNRSEV